MNKKKSGKQLMRANSLTPEQVLAARARARFRFRAMVRFVMRNLYWLEDFDDLELGEDIQKNIFVLTRKKDKKSLLSLQDKAILSKPAEARTEVEKQHLSRIIGGLKCFRRYPAHVKSELAGVSYFFYFGPGRTIVRQGDKSTSLYFIITGEVLVSQESFDPLLNKMVRHEIAVMGPGSMFGEVSLLHDIPRTATIVTNTHVELLCLKKKDFDIILKSTVQQQWQEVQDAMGNFSYFRDWDDISIRECCILSKMKSYLRNQTVLGDGVGLADYVYFVLKGKCRVIEHLLVTSKVVCGKKFYKLYSPPPNEIDDTSHKSAQLSGEAQKTEMEETVAPGEFSMQNLFDEEQPSVVSKISDATSTETQKAKPKKSDVNLPPEVETHFMQVCFFDSRACFGIGENMNHRRIVASVYTECLLIPRYWLLQRKKANVWSKVRVYLNNHIPTTQHVFKEFVKQRRWLQHRKEIADAIVSKSKSTNENNIANVPYFIRIHEQIYD